MRQTAPAHVRRVISEPTARQVTNLLQGVVARGTGVEASVEGYAVAGKTGTAQKFDATLGRYSTQKTLASFVGYLPAERPRVAILVSLDEPQEDMAWGSVAAAPVFGAIARPVMRYLRVPPDGGQSRVAEISGVRRTRTPASSAMLTLSAENFVENMREKMREMMGHMTAYVWGHFLTVDAKEARRPKKKSEPADR